MARTNNYFKLGIRYSVLGQSRERQRKKKKIKTAKMAVQIELFTKGNNPYYGQFIKARKEEGRLYVTVARS